MLQIIESFATEARLGLLRGPVLILALMLATGCSESAPVEAIAEKTACELESYPEQGVQYLEELKTILNEEGSDYAT